MHLNATTNALSVMASRRCVAGTIYRHNGNTVISNRQVSTANGDPGATGRRVKGITGSRVEGIGTTGDVPPGRM
jgi:hypothetical protein